MAEVELPLPERSGRRRVAGPRSTGSNWLLIDATLGADERDFLVYLEAEGRSGAGDGNLNGVMHVRRAMPVTLKGRLREVIELPFDPVKLRLINAEDAGSVQVLHCKVRALSEPHARMLMAIRVWRYWRRMTPGQRKQWNVHWHSIVTDLQGANDLVGRLRANYPELSYQDWLIRCASVNSVSQSRLKRLPVVTEFQMTVLLVTDGRSQSGLSGPSEPSRTSGTGAGATVRSLLGQVGVPTPDVRMSADEVVGEGWVCVCQAGVVFEPWAMAWLAHDKMIAACDLVYSDHDVIDERGERSQPCFKPDWSPEMAMVTGYMGQTFWISARLWNQLPQDVQSGTPYSIFMRAAYLATAQRIGHVPAILWHASKASGDGYARPNAQEVQAQVDIRANNWPNAWTTSGSVVTDHRDQLRVRYEILEAKPRVSIIIPTRNLLHMLQPCVESVLAKTTWPNFEVIVVDNQSDCPDTLAYMQTLRAIDRVRVLSYDHPFNFAAIQNFAVQQSKGELICLLNNDTEVITHDWLDEMAGRLSQPDVGVVGARLLYGDGRLQHAGDVLGAGGCASHLHGAIAGDDPGYMNRAVLPQDLSAVTAACLLVRKSLYEAMGGFDADNLPVAFNDVDFCLRVRRAGYRVVYTPYAELFHYESVSRGADNNPEKQARALREARHMRRTWPEVIANDPFYNPNLNQGRPDLRLGRVRNVLPPWE